MFQEAYRIASGFTYPLIISTRTAGGECNAGIATFIVLNEDGWIVTAGHAMLELVAVIEAERKARDVEAQIAVVEQDDSLSFKEKRKKVNSLRTPNHTVHRASALWGDFGGSRLVEAKSLGVADLAVGRIEPFDPSAVRNFPVLKDPKRGVEPGVTLCKIGFPFHSVTPGWDESTQNFHLSAESLPLPRFPIEGIYTRDAAFALPDGATVPDYPVWFIETSTPGLKGQSGGPTVDKHGTVRAIQSRTVHLPLGFDPPMPGGRKGEREHQFLNVGLGVHPVTLIGYLDSLGLKYSLSTY
jgi:hypothetical protein